MTGEIPETRAVGSIARCYDDIRQRLGVPMVNLVWRRLAALGALERCWEQVREDLPAITAQAAVLNGLARERLSNLSPSLRPSISASTIARAIIQSYERGNCINLATMRQLLGAPPLRSSSGRLPQAPDRIPPVPVLAELPARVRSAIEQLAQAGPAAATGITPTLWIHLADPPGLIERLARALTPVLGDADFRKAHSALTLLGDQLPPPHTISAQVRDCLQAFHQRIAEMVLIGVYLDDILSPDGEIRS